jgi:hypothetical protein
MEVRVFLGIPVTEQVRQVVQILLDVVGLRRIVVLVILDQMRVTVQMV